jgi:hypothetical protein
MEDAGFTAIGALYLYLCDRKSRNSTHSLICRTFLFLSQFFRRMDYRNNFTCQREEGAIETASAEIEILYIMNYWGSNWLLNGHMHL